MKTSRHITMRLGMTLSLFVAAFLFSACSQSGSTKVGSSSSSSSSSSRNSAVSSSSDAVDASVVSSDVDSTDTDEDTDDEDDDSTTTTTVYTDFVWSFWYDGYYEFYKNGESPDDSNFQLIGPQFKVFTTSTLTDHTLVPLYRLLGSDGLTYYLTGVPTATGGRTFSAKSLLGYLSTSSTTTASQPIYICISEKVFNPFPVTSASICASMGGQATTTVLGYGPALE